MKLLRLSLIAVIFVPIISFGQNYLEQIPHRIERKDYWRLTREITQQHFKRMLFSEQTASEWVVIKRLKNNSVIDEFSVRLTADEGWARIVFSDLSHYLNSFGDKVGEPWIYKPNEICRSPWVWVNGDHIYNVYLYVALGGSHRVLELLLTMWRDSAGHQKARIQYNREFKTGAVDDSLGFILSVAYQMGRNSSGTGDDYLWVSDTGNHRLIKIRLRDGKWVERFGKYGRGDGQFIYPTYLSTSNSDSSTQLFVNDSGNRRLVKIDVTAGTRWESTTVYYDRYLGRLYADPHGDGVWAVDMLNHQLVRYDRNLNELFDYGTRGRGQTPGFLEEPTDITGCMVSVVDEHSTRFIYKNLLLVTEEWSDGSGQILYRIKPQYVKESFKSTPVRSNPVLQENHNVKIPTWMGTKLQFSVSDKCLLRAWIYNNDKSEKIRTFWPSGRKVHAGMITINWDGRSNDGEVYHDSLAHLSIQCESLYDSHGVSAFTFQFTPRLESDSLIIPVPEVEPKMREGDLALYPNYPNPFNGGTLIRFYAPEEGTAVIRIINILGRQVDELEEYIYQPGDYTMKWNGTDSNGFRVASGTYVYQITFNGTSGTQRATGKLLLLK